MTADKNWSSIDKSNVTTILENSNRVTYIFSKHFASCWKGVHSTMISKVKLLVYSGFHRLLVFLLLDKWVIFLSYCFIFPFFNPYLTTQNKDDFSGGLILLSVLQKCWYQYKGSIWKNWLLRRKLDEINSHLGFHYML